jgi:hypothetical protein
MAVILVCNGEVTVVNENPRCDTGWEVSTHVAPFDISGIDPAVATGFFAAGFVLFIIPWAAAYGFKTLLSFLRDA